MLDVLDVETALLDQVQLSDEQRQKIADLEQGIERFLNIPINPETGRAGGINIKAEVLMLELQKVARLTGRSALSFDSRAVGTFSPDEIEEKFGTDPNILQTPAYKINSQTLRLEKLPEKDGVMVYEEGLTSYSAKK